MSDNIPTEVQARLDAGKRVWTTAELTDEFDVQGFAMGYVVVRRRSDGVVGSLTFTHRPRFYFDFQED